MPHFFQGHPGSFQAQQKTDAENLVLAVLPVTVRFAVSIGQQTNALIIAYCILSQAGQLGSLADGSDGLRNVLRGDIHGNLLE
ncbi:hypothetical protein D3C75_1106490 [compost metagenome]